MKKKIANIALGAALAAAAAAAGIMSNHIRRLQQTIAIRKAASMADIPEEKGNKADGL